MIAEVDAGRSWRVVSRVVDHMPRRLVSALELTLGPDGVSDCPHACARLGELGPLAVDLGGRGVEQACRRLLGGVPREGDDRTESRALGRARTRYEDALRIYVERRSS